MKGGVVVKEFRQSINLGVKSSEHGRSTMMVKCPFCEKEFEVYIWSFAGSGKRCSCGALLGRFSCVKGAQNG